MRRNIGILGCVFTTYDLRMACRVVIASLVAFLLTVTLVSFASHQNNYDSPTVYRLNVGTVGTPQGSAGNVSGVSQPSTTTSAPFENGSMTAAEFLARSGV